MSSSDWDWESTDWAIYTGDYVSSPSCVRLTKNGIVGLCKTSGLTVVPEGRIVTQIKLGTSGTNVYGGLCFRNQAAVGSPTRVNMYRVDMATNVLSRLVYRASSTDSVIATFSPGMYLPTSWTKIRVTFWDNWGKLRVTLEKWNTGTLVWDDLGFIDDPNNYWNASSINRWGIYANCNASNPAMFDDTEIWTP